MPGYYKHSAPLEPGGLESHDSRLELNDPPAPAGGIPETSESGFVKEAAHSPKATDYQYSNGRV